ncbi:NlpC/P60 family protein [Hyphobacterium sp. HN65]|uniref:NlpC/P60 family protein n=1 Tax=Hyphobacterium lacteum TaxID=3116575 RepID=A0ABU7LNJ9_9PROT|nr:NlpC/P60 family protein [Hyphobacterium sp. HN65]MEE2525503.1 NlpC/P60 family protein [Hyphobacterium sp. HN65]
MADLDNHPRLLPARPDLAAAHLKGRVEAERFVEPVEMQVTAGCTAIRREPRDDGAMDTQALFGEVFAVLEERDGWAWGFSRYDGYVGWVDMTALSQPVSPATHRVSALRTYLFSEPDLKSAPNCLVSMNAKIAAGQQEGRFIDVGGRGWIFEGHVVPLGHAEPDFVSVAERFVGSPYFWGGKESLGLDCSGLLQCALEAAGIPVLRDAWMQEADLGARYPVIPNTAARRRGDVVFWAGHVGIMTDADHIVHANATFMETVIEPVAETERRAVESGSPVTSVVRVAA